MEVETFRNDLLPAMERWRAAGEEIAVATVVRVDGTAPRREGSKLLVSAGGELGVTELANRTGLVPSTAHRLLHTLTKRGYVTQSPETGRYLLGYKVVEVASGLEHRRERLRAVARPHLESIQRATGETVNLVVLDSGLLCCRRCTRR